MIESIKQALETGASWGRVAYYRAGKSKVRQVWNLASATGKLLGTAIQFIQENELPPGRACGHCASCMFYEAIREFAHALGKPDVMTQQGLEDEIRRIFVSKAFS